MEEDRQLLRLLHLSSLHIPLANPVNSGEACSIAVDEGPKQGLLEMIVLTHLTDVEWRENFRIHGPMSSSLPLLLHACAELGHFEIRFNYD